MNVALTISGSILRWAVALGWAAMIFTFSTRGFGSGTTRAILSDFLRFLHVQLSPAGFEYLHIAARKLAHLTEYGIFALLLYGVRNHRPFTEWNERWAFMAIAIAAAFSLTDEFHQVFVPGRHPSFTDCGIDIIGAALAMLVPFSRRHAIQETSLQN